MPCASWISVVSTIMDPQASNRHLDNLRGYNLRKLVFVSSFFSYEEGACQQNVNYSLDLLFLG